MKDHIMRFQSFVNDTYIPNGLEESKKGPSQSKDKARLVLENTGDYKIYQTKLLIDQGLLPADHKAKYLKRFDWIKSEVDDAKKHVVEANYDTCIMALEEARDMLNAMIKEVEWAMQEKIDHEYVPEPDEEPVRGPGEISKTWQGLPSTAGQVPSSSKPQD